MSYHADIPRMRLALTQIQSAFPLQTGIPDSVQTLFQVLAQLSYDAVKPWSEHLTSTHLDLLCDHYHQAPNTRVLLVITLILWHREDARLQQLVQSFFHQIPPKEERVYLASQWSAMQKKCPQLPQWLDRYLAKGCALNPIDHLTEYLHQGLLKQQDLDRDFPETSPLFRALTDALFRLGGELCHHISGARAHTAALRYIDLGEDQLLLAFLTHYPHERWLPELMDALRQTKGPPDPEQSTFWQQLERPRLWGIRGMMFLEQMKAANYSAEKTSFWRKWLHKTQSWHFNDKWVRIVAKPLIIEDRALETSIAMAQNPNQVMTKVPNDYAWERVMERLFNEYLSWEQQY